MLFCGCAIAHSFAYYTQWMQLTGTLDPQIGLRCLNLESRKTMYFLCFVCTCVVSDKMLTLRRNAHHQMEDRSLSPSCSPNRFTCEGVLVPLQMAWWLCQMPWPDAFVSLLAFPLAGWFCSSYSSFHLSCRMSLCVRCLGQQRLPCISLLCLQVCACDALFAFPLFYLPECVLDALSGWFFPTQVWQQVCFMAGWFCSVFFTCLKVGTPTFAELDALAGCGVFFCSFLILVFSLMHSPCALHGLTFTSLGSMLFFLWTGDRKVSRNVRSLWYVCNVIPSLHFHSV